MSAVFTVSLAKIIKEFNLEQVYMPCEASKVLIASADVNRPGLHFAGFFDYFDPKRIQIIGRAEYSFLKTLGSEEKIEQSLDAFFSHHPPAVIVTRGLDIFPQMIAAAQKYEVPLLETTDSTSTFQSSLVSTLNVELAPRITRHGVLVEEYCSWEKAALEKVKQPLSLSNGVTGSLLMTR